MLVCLTLKRCNISLQCRNLGLFILGLLLPIRHLLGLVLNSTLQLFNFVDFVGSHANCRSDILRGLLNFTQLTFALVNIRLFTFVGGYKCFVNTSILKFKLLQVIYVNNRVAELVKVMLDVLKLVLVES